MAGSDPEQIMNRRIAIIGIGALAVLASASQDGVLLRRQLTAGSTEVYNVTMKSANTTPMGDMSIDATMKMTYKMGEVKDGKADLDIITSDMTLKYGGMAEMAAGMMGDVPKTVTMKGKIDERNRITDMKTVGMTMQMAMMMNSQSSSMNQSVSFPENAVKIGDTWDVVVPANAMMGTAETKFTAKYDSNTMVDGKPAMVIKMTGTMPMKLDMAELAKKNPEMAGGQIPPGIVIEGKIDMKLDSVVDRASGKTLTADILVKNINKVSGEGLPMEIDINGTTTIRMALAK